MDENKTGKRITVIRMIRNRIHTSLETIKNLHALEDLEKAEFDGSDEVKYNQQREVMRDDLEQLNFLKRCLQNKERIIQIMQEND